MTDGERYPVPGRRQSRLGGALNHTGIRKICYREFRARLLQHGRECDAFNVVNQLLVERGLQSKREAMTVDACHLDGGAVALNPRLLIRCLVVNLKRFFKLEPLGRLGATA